MKTPEQTRIKTVQKTMLNMDKTACMIISSAPESIRTRDEHFPFRQDSDFYYLTGCIEKDLTLVISSEAKNPSLIAPKPDPVRALWDGAPRDYRTIAKQIGADLVISDSPYKEIRERIKGHSTLFHQNRPGAVSTRIASELQSLPSYQRGNYPETFCHIDVILEEMRLYKDPSELQKIEAACSVTAQAIIGTLQVITPGVKESIIARTIEYWFGMMDASPGFGTIAATGPSAATLHYRECSRKLKKGDLFLIDCGAELNMYNGDISRVFPVGGTFSPVQKALYDIVLWAQYAALQKIKDGVLIQAVYDAAARVMVEGLVELKVLKGKVSKLLADKAYKPYFPHGIGHSLGIDIHDVGKHRGNNQATLKAGMVFTVEPGLYFPKKVGYLQPCGVRIEDDVVVTKTGCRVLTAEMPKEPDEIEMLLAL